jgi:hypothetical protein
MDRDEIQEIRNGFQAFYLSRSLAFMRAGLAFALFGFIVSGLIDVDKIQILIRYVVICPVLLIALILSFTKFFRSFSQEILTATYVVVSGASVFIVYYTRQQSELRELYLIALALWIIAASVIRIRSKWVIPASLFILFFFGWLCRSNPHDMQIHLPLLALVSAYSSFSIYSFEKTVKDSYTAFWLLDNERKSLLKIKAQLASANSEITKLQAHVAEKHSL